MCWPGLPGSPRLIPPRLNSYREWWRFSLASTYTTLIRTTAPRSEIGRLWPSTKCATRVSLWQPLRRWMSAPLSKLWSSLRLRTRNCPQRLPQRATSSGAACRSQGLPHAARLLHAPPCRVRVAAVVCGGLPLRRWPARSQALQGSPENRASRGESAPAAEELQQPEGRRHTACARGRSSRACSAPALASVPSAGSQAKIVAFMRATTPAVWAAERCV